jgi:hypothetical protein
VVGFPFPTEAPCPEEQKKPPLIFLSCLRRSISRDLQVPAFAIGNIVRVELFVVVREHLSKLFEYVNHFVLRGVGLSCYCILFCFFLLSFMLAICQIFRSLRTMLETMRSRCFSRNPRFRLLWVLSCSVFLFLHCE